MLEQGAKAGELRLFAGRQDLPETALHEFVHLVTLEINPSFANSPRWLWEAIAIYKSEQQRKYAEDPNSIRNRFESMAQRLQEGRDAGVIYEVGYTIGEFIENTWGQEVLISLIKSSGDFSVLTEKSLDQVFLEWKGFVNKKYFEK